MTAPIHFNLRVVETRLAAAIIAKKLLIPETESIYTLRGVADAYFAKMIEKGELESRVIEKGNEIEALDIMIQIVEKQLGRGPFSMQDVCLDLCKNVFIHH